MPVSKRLHAVLAQNLSDSRMDSRRVFHGRGSTYPGYEHLVIDWYAPVLWVVLFREPEEGWLEEYCRGSRYHLKQRQRYYC